MKYRFQPKRPGIIKRTLTNFTAIAVILANTIGASLPFVLATGSASAATADFYVSSAGADTNSCASLADACATISEAVAKANADGIETTISVGSGTYAENVQITTPTHLVGTGTPTLTSASGYTLEFKGNSASGSSISGFNLNSSATGVVLKLETSANLNNITISGNNFSSTGGNLSHLIYGGNLSNSTINNNTFNVGAGIKGVNIEAGSVGNSFNGNTFTGSTDVLAFAAFTDNSSFSNNNLSGLTSSYAKVIEFTGTNGTATGNIYGASQITVTSNTGNFRGVFSTLAKAVEVSQPNDTIELQDNTVTNTEVVLDQPLTIDGNGFTISPNFSGSGGVNSVLEVFNTSDVTVVNTVVNGTNGTNLHGINIYESTGVNLSDVTVSNNDKAGVIVNSSVVYATNISTSGNTWYGINTDQNTSEIARLHISGNNTHTEAIHIKVDDNTKDVVVDDIDNQYLRNDAGQVSIYVLKSMFPVKNVDTGEYFTQIQPAIDDSDTDNGDTIEVSAGTYDENVNVNKEVTIIGAGKDSSGTKVEPASSYAFRIMANNVAIQDLSVSAPASYGFEVHSGTVNNLALNRVNAHSSSVGLKVATSASVDGLTVVDSNFDDNSQGWAIPAASNGASYFRNINVSGTTFNSNSYKGLYAEKLDTAEFNNIIIDGSGNGQGNGSGLNLNLKYSAYSDITVKNSTITSSGVGVTNGTGVNITARDDGSYAGNPATLDSVILTNNNISGNDVGARFGENNQTNNGPTNVEVINNNIDSNSIIGLDNQTAATPLNAQANWWGSNTGPTIPANASGTGDSVSDDVTYQEWLCQPYQDGSYTSVGGVCSPDPTDSNQLNISVATFNNRNSDRDRDNNEDLLAGWTMRLYEETGNGWEFVDGVHDVQTVDTGRVSFPAQKEAGTYHVCEVVQSGWEQIKQDWSGTPYHVATSNLSPNASEEGKWCRTIVYNDSADKSNASYFGNIDIEAPVVDITTPTTNKLVRGVVEIKGSVNDNYELKNYYLTIFDRSDNSIVHTKNYNQNTNISGVLASWDTSGLSGEYRIVIEARDAAENKDGSRHNLPATNGDSVDFVDILVDNEAPVGQITKIGDKTYTGSELTVRSVGGTLVIEGEAEDNVAMNRIGVQLVEPGVSGDIDYVYANGNGLYGDTGLINWQAEFDINALGVNDGRYAINVYYVDKIGNVSKQKNVYFILDNTAPNISWQVQPLSHYADGEVFHVRPITSEVGTVKSVYIDSVDPSNLCYTKDSDHKNMDTSNSHCQTLWDSLSDGQHEFIAVFEDYAGNSTTSHSNTFLIDRTAPQISVKNGFTGTLGTKIFSNVSFKLYDMYQVDKYVINGHESDFGNNKWSDANFQNIVSHLVEGPSNTIVLYDVAGNTTTYEFTYDSTAPATPVLSVQTLGGTPITSGATTNSYTVVANWTAVADSNGYEYRYFNSIAGDTYNAPNYYEVQTAATTRTGVFNRGEGLHHLQVRAYDAAANFSGWSPVFDVIYDATAPVVTINPLPQSTDTTPTITGTVDDSSADVFVSLNGATPQPATNNGDGTWTYAVTTGLSVGTHNIEVSASDNSGNSTSPNPTETYTVANSNNTGGGTVAGANTNTPSTGGPGTTNSPAATGATGGGNFAFATGANQDVLAAETTDEELDGIPEGSDVDGQVQSELDEANAVANGEDEESTSCTKILGICWYWWIPIGLAVVAILYAVFRPKDNGEI